MLLASINHDAELNGNYGLVTPGSLTGTISLLHLRRAARGRRCSVGARLYLGGPKQGRWEPQRFWQHFLVFAGATKLALGILNQDL